MALRQSFGASRWRIVRVVLVEGFVLSLAAWTVACLFAWWMSQILPGIIPASESGNAEVVLDFTPDWNVLAYAMLLAASATIIFTLAPGVRTWRQDLLTYLKAGEQGIAERRSTASRMLVVLQLAFSVVLLTSAGLGYRSLGLIRDTDLGFDTRNLLLLTVDTAGSARTADANAALLDAMLDRLRAIPGLESVSYSRFGPGSWPARHVRAGANQQPVTAEHNQVGPGYLRTLRLAPAYGREFRQDREGGVVEAIVNQHLADALWPGESAVGRTILLGPDDRPALVVGVATNALVAGFRRQPRPFFVFLPAEQEPTAGGITTLYARYAGGLDGVVPVIRRALHGVAPGVPLAYIRMLDSELDGMTWTYRTLTTLLMMFAGGSLLIAALGQYAAMSFTIRRRVRDYGIRMALGASAQQILRSAIREGLVLTAIGLAFGLLLGGIAEAAGTFCTA